MQKTKQKEGVLMSISIWWLTDTDSTLTQWNNMSALKISRYVCVWERGLFSQKRVTWVGMRVNLGEIDIISAANPQLLVHECKVKVDGITKYIENHPYKFDNTFHENEQTLSVYESTIKPLIKYLFNKGVVTCFAYGQTGSGKTYTMVWFSVILGRSAGCCYSGPILLRGLVPRWDLLPTEFLWDLRRQTVWST